jgi:hypothetical protein
MTNDDSITIPTSATRLARKAEQHGWTVRTTATRGTWRGGQIDSVAVRLRRGEQRLVALWYDGAFRCALQRSPLARFSSRELKALVEEGS